MHLGACSMYMEASTGGFPHSDEVRKGIGNHIAADSTVLVPIYQPVCRRVVVGVVDAGALHHQEESPLAPPQDLDGLLRHLPQRGVQVGVALVLVGHVVGREHPEEVVRIGGLHRPHLPGRGDELGALSGVARLPRLDEVDAVLAVALEDLVRLEDVVSHRHPPLFGHERVVAASQDHLGATPGLVVDQLPGDVLPRGVPRRRRLVLALVVPIALVVPAPF